MTGAGIDPLRIGERFTTGDLTIDDWVSARLLERIARAPGEDAEIARAFKLVPYRKTFDELRSSGAYDRQIAPGGVGEAYDSVGRYFDRASIYAVCPLIAKRAARELEVAGIAPHPRLPVSVHHHCTMKSVK
jgi:hypothetical protein